MNREKGNVSQHLLRGVAVYAFWAFCSAGSSAAGATLTDPIANYSYMAGHTAGLLIDSTDPQFFDQTTRVKRSDSGAPESFYYHISSMRGFVATVYYYTSQTPGDIVVFGSNDSQTWYPIHVFMSTPTTTSGNWYRETMQPAGDFPSGCSYLGFCIKGGSETYSPQMTQVNIDFDGPMPALHTAAPRVSAPDPIAAPAPSVVIPRQPLPVNNGYGTGQAMAYVGRPLGAPAAQAPQAMPSHPQFDPGTVMSIPGAMTVMAASGQAAVNWYPIPMAVSYTLRRSDNSADDDSYATLATRMQSTSYIDHGLQDGHEYAYMVTGYGPRGGVVGSLQVSATLQPGSVLLVDPLSDWSLASSHTDDLDFDTADGNIGCVTRLSDTDENFTYNLPGAVRFAFNLYYTGDFTGQVAVDASPDNATWTTVPLANTTPIATPTGYVAVFAPGARLPVNTNYLRFHLMGKSNPEMAMVRITYGAANHMADAAPGSTSAQVAEAPSPASVQPSSSEQPATAPVTSP